METAISASMTIIEANTRQVPDVPLDRETKALLNWVSNSPSGSVSTFDLETMRVEYKRTLAKTDVDPPPIANVADRVIDGLGGPLTLRVYTPNPSDGTALRPGLLVLHGGGCVVGDLETHDTLCRTFCSDVDAVVISVDYRLAPEHPFPAAVEDTVASLRWLSANAAELGVDATRLGIAGDSAGAGLAAVALHECRGELSAPVRAQVLIYPALDLRARLPSRRQFANVFPLPADMIEWFHDQYFGLAWPRIDPRAIPMLYSDYSGLPPTLVITAGADPLRDEGIEYAERLAAAGVPVTYECCEGTIHGFMKMGRILRTAYRKGRGKIVDFLVDALALPDAE
jgi:acetyl esterase